MLTSYSEFSIISTLSNEVISLKWTKSELLQAENNTIEFDEMIEFNEADLKKVSHLRKLKDVEVSGDIHYDVFCN